MTNSFRIFADTMKTLAMRTIEIHIPDEVDLKE